MSIPDPEAEKSSGRGAPYTYLDRFYVHDYYHALSMIPRNHPGTCSWLLEDNRLKVWLAGIGPKLFWLHGHPGLGKSVIARYLIENLGSQSPITSNFDPRDSEAPITAFFLGSYRDAATTSTRGLLSSLIHQLLFKDLYMALPISSQWPVIDNSVIEPIWNLWRMLSMIFSAMGPRTLLIVIDAVDEIIKDG